MIRRICLTLLSIFLFSFVSSSAETGHVYQRYSTLACDSFLEALNYNMEPDVFLNEPASINLPGAEIPESKESAPEEGTAATTDIKISFVGDCTLGTDESFSKEGNFTYRLTEHNGDFSYFFEGVQDIFKTDDITIANLETTLTEAREKAKKKFRFRGKPEYVRILQEGSIEAVNISNNHIRDYLQKGLDDTIKALQDARIGYFGEGNLLQTEIKGVRIVCLGFTGWDLSQKKKIVDHIVKARKEADILIVSFHWGQERVNYPDTVQKTLGRVCIENGADIVVGHHPHVIQGIEEYMGKYIVYSLGNFCFGGNRNPPDKDTFIFQACFSMAGGKIVKSEGKAIPCCISSRISLNDYRPRVLSGADKSRVLERLSKYSAELEYGVSSLFKDELISNIAINK